MATPYDTPSLSCTCEDRPCCGCLGEYYGDLRAAEDYSDYDEYWDEGDSYEDELIDPEDCPDHYSDASLLKDGLHWRCDRCETVVPRLEECTQCPPEEGEAAPLRQVVQITITEPQRDATEVLHLSCGHYLI